MEKYIYCCRFIFPASGIMAVVLCFLLQAPAPVTIAMIIAAILTLLCADPFDMLRDLLAPQTRIIITCCTIADTATGYAYYFCSRLEDYKLPVEIGIFLGILTAILLLISGKLNARWLDRYQYLDCREVSCALVGNADYKYNRFWNTNGRRMCASLLNHHLNRRVTDEDMEHTIRHVFICGMAAGDRFSSELLQENKALAEKAAAAENAREKLENEFDKIIKRKVTVQTDDLQEEIRILKSKNAVLSGLNTGLNKQIAEAKKEAHRADSELQEVKKALYKATSEANYLQGNIEDIYKPGMDLLEQLQTELKTLQTSAGSELLSELRDQNELMQSELNQYDQTLEMKNYCISSLESELQGVKEQLDEALTKIDILEEHESCHLAPVQTLPIRPDREENWNQAAASISGKGGRPAALNAAQLSALIQDRKNGMSIGMLAEKYEISKASVSRICKDNNTKIAL